MFLKLRSKRGITLIELLSTVVIVGILSAMAMPKFQIALERISFKSANRKITSSLRLARSRAISEKQQYGVSFDNGGSMGPGLTYTLFKDMVNLEDYIFEDGDSVIRIDTLPREFLLLMTDMANNTLVFKPNGTAGFVGGGYIVTYAQSEDLVAILDHSVLASTGRVRSTDYYY